MPFFHISPETKVVPQVPFPFFLLFSTFCHFLFFTLSCFSWTFHTVVALISVFQFDFYHINLTPFFKYLPETKVVPHAFPLLSSMFNFLATFYFSRSPVCRRHSTLCCCCFCATLPYIRHFVFADCYDNNHWYLVTNLDLAGFYFSKCPANSKKCPAKFVTRYQVQARKLLTY
jgi:hypothetical protein